MAMESTGNRSPRVLIRRSEAEPDQRPESPGPKAERLLGSGEFRCYTYSTNILLNRLILVDYTVHPCRYVRQELQKLLEFEWDRLLVCY